MNEIEILKRVDNKNVIRLIGTSVSFPHVLACLENMAFDDIETYLRANNKMNKQIIVKISKQICSAMIYLIGKYIIHRDLRSRNIFIGYNNFVKLSNFGLARNLDLNYQYIANCGSKEGFAYILFLFSNKNYLSFFIPI